MKINKFVSKVFLTLFFILTFQFVYYGITTTPASINEGDSLIYHIPIAKEIAKGNFIPPKIIQGLGFYPAASEIILAAFMSLRIPLNLFGVLGFVLLFYFSKKTAEAFDLQTETAIVFAGSVVMLESVLRWPLTQTVDIWLAVFFLASLCLFKKPDSSNKYYLLLGVANGFLIGSKYSGLPFFAILIFFFGKSVFSKINFKKLMLYLTPVFVIGFSWYVRNYIITGNPLYPANFLFLQGDPEFSKLDSVNWSVLGSIIQNPSFIWKLTEAMMGEFLTWALAFPISIYLLWKGVLAREVKDLTLVSLAMFVVFALLFPASPIVSNLRYIYPSIIALMLASFIYFRKYLVVLFLVCLVTSTLAFTNLEYHPKILVLSFAPALYLAFNKNLFTK